MEKVLRWKGSDLENTLILTNKFYTVVSQGLLPETVVEYQHSVKVHGYIWIRLAFRSAQAGVVAL